MRVVRGFISIFRVMSRIITVYFDVTHSIIQVHDACIHKIDQNQVDEDESSYSILCTSILLTEAQFCSDSTCCGVTYQSYVANVVTADTICSKTSKNKIMSSRYWSQRRKLNAGCPIRSGMQVMNTINTWWVYPCFEKPSKSIKPKGVGIPSESPELITIGLVAYPTPSPLHTPTAPNAINAIIKDTVMMPVISQQPTKISQSTPHTPLVLSLSTRLVPENGDDRGANPK